MMSKLSRYSLVLLILMAATLTGCNLLPEVKDETANWTAEQLYKDAHESLLAASYTRAIKSYDTLESRFPYGRLAQQAILEGAYANYRQGEATTALAACERFIRTYPNHPNVDYAYYLKGLINFREDQGLLGYVVETDLSERDPKMTKEAYGAFRELVTRFPDSRYAEDSAERMRYLTNALAGYEVHVARYYYNRGAYVAAANRAQATLINYPKTPANRDALVLLADSYDKLGMAQLRDDTRRVMKETFPDAKYVVATQKPWWKFWGKDEVAPPPPTDDTAKPWWKFW
jgi:outer membrane protein assembly factor BamD